MSHSEPEAKNCAGMIIGIFIMVVGFFGGFLLPLGMDDLPTFTMIFLILVIPMGSFLVGAAIMIYSMKGTGQGSGFFSGLDRRVDRPKETSYVHEPPAYCSSCGGHISAETIEWVGPLTVKCPYCGATHPTVKRVV